MAKSKKASSTAPRNSGARGSSRQVVVADPSISPRGVRVTVLDGSAGAADVDAEVRYHLHELKENAAINHGGTLQPGQTHVLKQTPGGPDVLTRKRFSAT